MARIRGTNASETLNGTSGNDSITGNGGDDLIIAGSGNDYITGGDGADYIYGGSGIDTVSYEDSTAGVYVQLGASGYAYHGTGEGDRLFSIEDVVGSNHNDSLIGDNGGNILTGLSGHDSLIGNGGADTLLGGSGNDDLTGGSGGDVLNGGLGVDTASYRLSGAGVFISLYNDAAAGGDAEGDELDSIENINGSSFHDDLWGHDGANILNGEGGDDTLKGFGGADTLSGGFGNDWLYGMDGFDTLYGGSGMDMLSGGNGDDTLIGGANGDRMVGGANADTFVFNRTSDIGRGSLDSSDYDLITDFEIGIDRIDLSAIDANSLEGGNQAFTVVGAFTGQAGQLMIVEGFFDGISRPAVLIDLNGDAVEDAFFFVDTTSGALPSATDFIL
jgi:Ca2+-binding RTX toxin-like protein